MESELILSDLLLVPLEDTVVFPGMTVTLTADTGDEDRVLLVPRHESEYAKVGTVAEVADRVRLPGGGVAVAFSGQHRAVIGAAHTDSHGRLRVEVEERPDDNPPPVQTRELEREYRAVVEEILELRDADERIGQFLRSITDAGSLAEEYRKKIEEAGMPDDVRAQAERELRRLETMGDASGEASMIRTYLDWLVSVPWSQRSDETLDPRGAREVLDADHAGLEDVKDRIVEYLAVRKLRQDRGIPNEKKSGAILTLIGPPGTGKTSIGESVARALN